MEVSSCFFKPLDLFLKPPSESHTLSPVKVVNHFASGHNSTFETSTHLGDIKNASAQTIDAIEPLESIVRKPFRSKSTQPGISDSNVVDSQDKSPIKQGSSEVYLKWRKLTLVAQSIHRFKSLRVERIKSAGNLREMIQDTRLTERNFLEDDGALYITPAEKHIDALESFRNQQIFFKYLESAGKKDLVEIQKMLLKDPKAYLYDADSPYRLANRPNHRGYTPLYVACRNGNLELVRLLLKNKANPYQLSLVGPNQNESILLVAARWGHLELVKYLTGKDFVWPETELRKACKEAMESQAKEYLKDQVQKNSKSFFGRFFSF